MKPTTKRYLGIAAALTVIIGAAGGVLARGGYGPGFGAGWGGHHGMMGAPGAMHGGFGPAWHASGDPAAYADQRLERLHETLGITPEQEEAWNAYAGALKDKAELAASHHQAMTGQEVDPEQRLAFREEGLAHLQKLNAAARDLYSVLKPEQQPRAGRLTGGGFGPCMAW